MEEIWKPIENYTNYSVSNLGRVKNTNTNNFISVSLKNEVTLRKNGSKCKRNLPLLVVTYFLDVPVNYSRIIHKDGNIYKNQFTNLGFKDVKKDLIGKNFYNYKVIKELDEIIYNFDRCGIN